MTFTINLSPIQAQTLKTMLSAALEQLPARHSDPDIQEIVNNMASLLDLLPTDEAIDHQLK